MKNWTLLVCLIAALSTTAQNLEQGIAMYEKGQLEEAANYFSKATRDYPSNAKATYYLGRIAFDTEDYEEAVEYFELAVEKDKGNAEYYVWLGNAIGTLAGESNFFRQGILAPKIKTAYERAVELDPGNVDGHWGLIEYYTQAPGVLGGSWEKAEETADAMKKLDAAEGHEALGTVYERQDKSAEAEQEYIRAAELEPARYASLGFYYQGKEMYSQAFEAFAKAYAHDQQNLGALYQIGRTSALSGLEVDRGIESLNMYLSQDWKPGTPSHAGALWRLGMIYERKGDKTNAIAAYERALVKEPGMDQAEDALDRLK